MNDKIKESFQQHLRIQIKEGNRNINGYEIMVGIFWDNELIDDDSCIINIEN